MSLAGGVPCFPGRCGVGAVGFESVGWKLPSRRLVRDRGERASLLPHVLGLRTRTSWVCCIPYSTKKKARDTASGLEKVVKTWRAGKGLSS